MGTPKSRGTPTSPQFEKTGYFRSDSDAEADHNEPVEYLQFVLLPQLL